MVKNVKQDLHQETCQDELYANITKAAEKYQEILTLLMQQKANPFFKPPSPEDMQHIAVHVANRVMTNPEKFINTNIEYATKFTALVSNAVTKFMGENAVDLYKSDAKDKRFRDPTWNQNIYFDFMKQFYLMSSEWAHQQTQQFSLESKYQKILEFYTKQFIDALCPSNFPIYNPEVIKSAINSKWENIVHGLNNLLADLNNSGGILNLNTADQMTFEIGRNIATTEGKIVLQTDMMELIHYKPKSDVYSTPILVVPPWINKYYILDLSQENSFVRYLIDNNFQVFMISWVNPDSALTHKNFEDYAQEGIISACKYMREELNFQNINAVGYCIGGTLLATTLAYLKAKNLKYINSATYFTTLLDFSEPGEIGLFMNEDTISTIETEMEKSGYLDGRYLANSFSMLRAKDLVWSFVVNNYLLGKRPLSFDLLYWNSDPANLPASMHSFYMRNMYLKNLLTKPGELTILNEPIFLSKVDVPSFFVGAKDDHIAPWRSVYNSMHLLGGEKTFCLAASGHVVGIVNHPSQKKYSYWISKDNLLRSATKWHEESEENAGSWWPLWVTWLQKYSGDISEENAYSISPIIASAPGSYVLKKCYEA